MSLVAQEILVGLLVAVSAIYSVWRLLSLHRRLRCLDALTALPGAGRARVLASLRERTLAKLGSGCAGCSSHPASTPGSVSPNRTSGVLRR
jgi:hypothetical protein